MTVLFSGDCLLIIDTGLPQHPAKYVHMTLYSEPLLKKVVHNGVPLGVEYQAVMKPTHLLHLLWSCFVTFWTRRQVHVEIIKARLVCSLAVVECALVHGPVVPVSLKYRKAIVPGFDEIFEVEVEKTTGYIHSFCCIQGERSQ